MAAPAPEAARATIASWGGGVPAIAAISERPLLSAELRRHARAAELDAGLEASDAEVQARAWWSLARIGDDAAAGRMAERLDAAPGSLAALGLLDEGAPHTEAIAAALAERWAPGDAATTFALARIGGEASMRRLEAEGLGAPSSGADAATAVGILCARGMSLSTGGQERLVTQLRAADREPRAAAAFAASRCARRWSGDRAALDAALAEAVAGDDPEVARLAWRSFAAIGALPEVLPEALLAATPTLPWALEVEAVRALVGDPRGRAWIAERLPRIDLRGASDPRIHALVEALSGLRASVSAEPELLAVAEATAARMTDDSPSALALRCEAAILASIKAGRAAGIEACGARAGAAAVAVASTIGGREGADALVKLAEDPQVTLALPAIGALGEVSSPAVDGALGRALEREDPALAAAAAGAIAERLRGGRWRGAAPTEALVKLALLSDSAGAIEARLSALAALAAAKEAGTRGAPRARLSPLLRDPNVSVRRAAASLLGAGEGADAWAPAQAEEATAFGPELGAQVDAWLRRPARALRIHTRAGVIEIDLRPAPAPINQANLVALAERGYFDGLTWHRVVPGFVIQGGDPRGDGSGGPGYQVPCEWSDLRYERGVVGVALAGKDTGGSQIFITQRPQPHLDGRYTIVGRVAQGMEVVDAMLAGDRIDRVEVVRDE
ncbi:MAG: peptidylprolyl isomerase [Nannocystaceae bacterium]